MKTLLIFLLIAMCIYSSTAQSSVENILEQVEVNNTTLKAYRSETDAMKMGNTTGLLPSNPEIEFNYLWGDPANIGNRTDVSVIQSFDFPTAYTYRSQIATLRDEQAELVYQRYRNELLHQVRMLLTELLRINAMVDEYSLRTDHARQLAVVYEQMLEAGESNILEVNKAEVNLLGISGTLDKLMLEQQLLLLELERLNGGNRIEITASSFDSTPLEADFDLWVSVAAEANPSLRWLYQQTELSKRQVKLNKALRLPGFHAGYMSEKVVGEHFQGVTAGMTIPLWENRNRVRFSKAQAAVDAEKEMDARLQFYAEMKMQHQKAMTLRQNADEFEVRLRDHSNIQLLDRALDAGEISLTEYLFELSAYYEAIDIFLELKYDALKARFVLLRYE